MWQWTCTEGYSRTTDCLLEWRLRQPYSRGRWKALYLDDILVSEEDEADHPKNLAKVEYLGHRVDAQRLQPVEKKVKAIMDAPAPTNVTELKAYLGLLNYYNKFLANLATLLVPLHKLLLNKEGLAERLGLRNSTSTCMAEFSLFIQIISCWFLFST